MSLQIPDQTIASQINIPDPMRPISGFLNIAQMGQNLKTSQLDYDIKDQANQARNAIRGIAKSPAMYNPDGTLKTKEFSTAAFQADPTQGADATQGALTNQGTQIGNEQKTTELHASQFKLSDDIAKKADSIASGLTASPNIVGAMDKAKMTDPGYFAKISNGQLSDLSDAEDAMVAHGVPKTVAKSRLAPLYQMATHDPSSLASALISRRNQSLDAQGQVSAGQPTFVDDGQVKQNVNPNAPGTPNIQNQLAPSTLTVGGPDGTTPGYLGATGGVPTGGMSATPGGMQIAPQAQAGMNGTQLALLQQERAAETNPANQQVLDREIMRAKMSMPQGQQQPQQVAQNSAPNQRGFVASGLPAGAATGITGTQDQINNHWKDTQLSASTAQQDIGVLQNIKQHAGDAITGVGAGGRSQIAGYTGWLAGKLNMTTGELEKTNTDLLAKNSNMLALAGGDTNAARSMAEMSSPNGHMTKEAIVQAADQVISQRRMSLAKANFLTPFKAMADQGHPEMYNNALNQFNAVGDPKVIQFNSMTPEEKSSMKTSMTPQERQEFGAKLGKARQLGIAQ